MPPGMNDTAIVLIPKEAPEVLKDFRPISLCNVVYKIVSKCMVNRLRPLLQEIIAPTQSAFIPGHMITDNALIAFECLHAIRQGNKECKEFGAYKLDLSKAYDRVDWNNLEGAMRRLGFQCKWIRWVMECVTTVQYSVRFNNVPLAQFKPSRSLRQGDPLSPYLFLFKADGLSKLLQHEVSRGSLSELRVCRSAPGISHLLFADNTLLFMKVKKDQAEIINKVLRQYEASTGQLINPSKCAIMFGTGCQVADKECVKEVLHVANVTEEEKYLGLPTPQGRISKEHFKTTRGQLAKRFTSWAERYMSMGAKEVLIKSVAQAIPAYVMGVFKLLASLCEEMNQMIRYFRRGEEGEQRKVHWTAWERILMPKCHGGLGFRDMRLFNQALLARQAWRLIQFPDSLCAQLLKAKYYPQGELIDTIFPLEVSPTWRAIQHGLELLKKGLMWRVRSGEKIQIWRDHWIPWPPFLKTSLNKGRSRLRWVSQLMQPGRSGWDEQILNSCLYPHDVEAILRIRLSDREGEDMLAWFYEKSGIFTVKSAYRLALSNENEERWREGSSSRADGSRALHKEIWAANVPPKVRVFAWRLWQDGLATQQNRSATPSCSVRNLQYLWKWG
jgi:hypothetical protein